MENRYIQYLCRGVVGLFAVPVLSVFSIGMCICSFVSVIGGVLYIVGIDIHLSIWKFGQVSQLSSFFISVMFGGILLLIAFGSWRLLQVSCHYVKKG
ncbi:hypothetical protein [Brevibacillus laterosporus]|uniref:Uncharacterized protein n=2 Tax=Brevibacillus laterosporus TaxID=1465 RepID=A0AAP3GAJ6_BRELA|nr:hypothetical protein [Brevibacillus laterosporus]MCZ0805605.1 hypothetical protein [Brevibacillus laterosporus]MCZ0825327.1 hypothetical protein [Brevibacillus laterosporus]PPA93128.1 hypothetical protein C4A77_20380 [Brevibacillus laterosporus]